MAISNGIEQLLAGLRGLALEGVSWHNNLRQQGGDRWGAVFAAQGVSSMVTPYTLAVGIIVYWNGLTQDEFDRVHRYVVRGDYAPHRRVRLARWQFIEGTVDRYSGYLTLDLWTAQAPTAPVPEPAATMRVRLSNDDGDDLGEVRA